MPYRTTMLVTEMTEETERPGFKYMIEFPNKFRIYAIDEQSLFSIVEKYRNLIDLGSSSNTTSLRLEKGPISRLPTISRCPECASPNIVFDNERAKVICMSCGLEIDAQNHMGNSEKPPLDSHTGYKISENIKNYKIMRKSRRGRSYTANISRSTVEEVYRFLKNSSDRLPVCKIWKALKINGRNYTSTVPIYNALRVLQAHGKVRVEPNRGPGRKGLLLFRAI